MNGNTHKTDIETNENDGMSSLREPLLEVEPGERELKSTCSLKEQLVFSDWVFPGKAGSDIE